MSSISSLDEPEGEVILYSPLSRATRVSPVSKSDSKKSQCAPAKGYAVTIFKGGWTPENWRAWCSSKVPKLPICEYIFGLEKCPKSSIWHLQCYFNFDKKIRAFPILKEVFGDTIHIEKARASKFFNYRYCTKEKDFFTNMTPPDEIKKKWNKFDTYIKDFLELDPKQVQDVQDEMARMMFQEKSHEVIVSRLKRTEIAQAIFLFLSEAIHLPERSETSDELMKRQRRMMKKL